MLTKTMPHHLGQDYINYYYRAIETDEHAGGVQKVSEAIHRDQMALFTWKTDISQAVIIVSHGVYEDGYSEMVVRMMAGRNASAEYETIVDEVTKMARFYGYNRVVAYVKPELWEKFKSRGANSEEIYVVIGRDAAPFVANNEDHVYIQEEAISDEWY